MMSQYDRAVSRTMVVRVHRQGDVDEPGRYEDLLATWVDVSNAGGAVGFVPPTSAAQVAPTLAATLQRVRDGHDDLVTVREAASAGVPGRHVAMAVLAANGSPLLSHWRTVLRVMVHPSRQGRGVGRMLMVAVHAHARSLGLDHVVLTVRAGQGIEPFYERLGYRAIGRHPRAIAVGPDDIRDEIVMLLDLRTPGIALPAAAGAGLRGARAPAAVPPAAP